MSDESHNRGWSPGHVWAVFVGLVIAGVLAYVAWWGLHVLNWHGDYAEAGAFGDAFGPIAGLLSTLALAAAVLSVFMQRAELQDQRRELALTREEMAKQREVAEAQAEAQKTHVRVQAYNTRAIALLAEATISASHLQFSHRAVTHYADLVHRPDLEEQKRDAIEGELRKAIQVTSNVTKEHEEVTSRARSLGADITSLMQSLDRHREDR